MHKLTACVMTGVLLSGILSGCGMNKTADEYAEQALEYLKNASSIEMTADVTIADAITDSNKKLNISGDDIHIQEVYSDDGAYTAAGRTEGKMSGTYDKENLSWSLDSYAMYDDGKVTDYTTPDGTKWESESSNANHADIWTITVQQLLASDSTTKWEISDDASDKNRKSGLCIEKPLSKYEMLLAFTPSMTGFNYDEIPLTYPEGQLLVYFDRSGRPTQMKITAPKEKKPDEFHLEFTFSAYNTVSEKDLTVPEEIRKNAIDRGFNGSITSNADAVQESSGSETYDAKTEKKPADLKQVNSAKYHVVSDDNSAGAGFDGGDEFKDVSVSDGGKVISSKNADGSISFNMLLISMDDLPAKDNAKVSHDADANYQADEKAAGAVNTQLTDVKETSYNGYPVYWYYGEETMDETGKVVQQYNYFVDLGNNNHASLTIVGTSGRGSSRVLSDDKAEEILHEFTFAGQTDRKS